MRTSYTEAPLLLLLSVVDTHGVSVNALLPLRGVVMAHLTFSPMARVATSEWPPSPFPPDPALNLSQKRREGRGEGGGRGRDLGYLPCEHVLKSPLSNALLYEISGDVTVMLQFVLLVLCGLPE